MWRSGGEKGLRLNCPGNSVFLSSEIGMLGNFLSCIKVVKYRFEFQEGTWDIPSDAAVEKGLIWQWWGNLVVYLELRRDSQLTTWNSGSLLCCPREVQSPFEL